MKKVKFRKLLLTGVFIIFLLSIPEAASAGGVADSLTGFSKLWPDGSYFSTTGGACGPGQTNGYCTYCQLAQMDWPAYEACGNGDTCWAFANYVFYNLFGYAPRNLSPTYCTNVNDVAVIGDYVICVDGNGNYTHYFIYMGSAGGYAYYAYESNIDVENKVRYCLKHCSEWGNLNAHHYLVIHAPNYEEKDGPAKDTIAPVISNVSVTDKTSTGFTVTCTATDNIGITDVSFVVYPADTKPNDSSWHSCTNLGNNRWSYTYTVPSQGKYSVRLYGWDGAGNWGEYIVEDQIFDTEGPVISDVQETRDDVNVTVTCTITDNVGVKSANVAPFYTGYAIDQISGTNTGNNKWRFVYPVKNKYGNEAVQVTIYAYDEASNMGKYELLSKTDTEKPEISDVVITERTDSYDVSFKVTDNVGIHQIRLMAFYGGNHNYSDIINEKAADDRYSWSFEKNDGIESYMIEISAFDAQNNQAKYIKTVYPSKHTHTPEKEDDRPATCTEDGYTGATRCSECGEILTERIVIPAKGHDWNSWMVMKEATASEEGLEIRTCRNDSSHIESRSIPKTAEHIHTPVKVGEDKEPTCTEDGYFSATKCSECGQILTEKQLRPSTGHDWSEWKIVQEPTTEKDGIKIRVCRNNPDHIDNAVIPAGTDPKETGDPTEPEDSRIDVQKLDTRYYLAKAVYTGYPLKPVFAKYGDVILEEGTDYTISYSNNINVGKASFTIVGIGNYKGERTGSFQITKATNSISVSPLSNTLKYAMLKKKAQTITLKAAASGENAKTSFDLISVPAKAKKYVSLSSGGKLKIKKGLKKGTHKIKLRVTSAATANYAESYVNKTVRIIVK